MIDLSRFAKVTEQVRYPFGIDAAGVAAALRNIADRVERGELTPQGALLFTEVSPESFTTETLIVQFNPKVRDVPFPSSPELAASIRAELRGAKVLIQYWYDPAQTPSWIISAWTAGETIMDVPLDPPPAPAELVMLSAMVRADAEERGFLARE